MDIQKAHWSNSENRVNLSFPITKVNKEKRTVSGFATLDNVDRHGDVVTSEASENAFKRFRGNLRQMHQPIAIGKVLSFHPEDYFDKGTGKTYKGIYVSAYVSKGAQDAWEKVLDGTYSGFSIGGNIVNASFEPGDTDEDNRVIKEYDLMELSLVDSPANQLANIFSIQKSADGTTIIKGMAADTNIENVYYCKTDNIASSSKDDSKDCVICGTSMNNIGWVENAETEKGLAISKLIDQYLKKDDAPGPDHSATTQDGDAASAIDSSTTINLHPDQNDENKIKKGGNKMTDETQVVEDTTIEKSVDAESTPADATLEKSSDEAVSTEETEAAAPEASEDNVEKSVTAESDENGFAKMLTDMRDLLNTTFEKNSAETTAAIEKSMQTVDQAKAEYENAVSQIKKDLEGLSNNIADFFKRVEALEKRASAYEQDTAIQKSVGDVDSSSRESNKIQKGFAWNGSFLGVQDF